MVIATHIMVAKMVVVFDHIKTYIICELYFLKNTITKWTIFKKVFPIWVLFLRIMAKRVVNEHRYTF